MSVQQPEREARKCNAASEINFKQILRAGDGKSFLLLFLKEEV